MSFWGVAITPLPLISGQRVASLLKCLMDGLSFLVIEANEIISELGKANPDQLLRIFKLFGTPNEQSWPRVTEYSEWKKQAFPVYPAQDLRVALPQLDADALDLVNSYFGSIHFGVGQKYVGLSTGFPNQCGRSTGTSLLCKSTRSYPAYGDIIMDK